MSELGAIVDRPPLEPVPDLAHARATLAAYRPRDAAQAELRARMIAFVDGHPRAHERDCRAGHLVASALLVEPRSGRVLLHLHRKLERWLSFGGHCDGDANLIACAWRETIEESGITPQGITAEPVDLDLHRIGARPGEPEHDHLDVRYVAFAPPGARERRSAESLELAWFSAREARALELDASLLRLLELGLPDPATKTAARPAR